ncbi:hypothetical protein NC651_001704 [Populus alba x Populus x berolinensis]|nr:hypothetical protein NC651_001704 [Populus alba x Populus x berolinensis]
MVNQNSKTGGLDFWDREEEKENKYTMFGSQQILI